MKTKLIIIAVVLIWPAIMCAVAALWHAFITTSKGGRQ